MGVLNVDAPDEAHCWWLVSRRARAQKLRPTGAADLSAGPSAKALFGGAAVGGPGLG